MSDLAATREECASLIDDMVRDEKPGRSKMVLAIAAKTVRRGRHLSAVEKLNNLKLAMQDWDEYERQADADPANSPAAGGYSNPTREGE